MHLLISNVPVFNFFLINVNREREINVFASISIHSSAEGLNQSNRLYCFALSAIEQSVPSIIILLKINRNDWTRRLKDVGINLGSRLK